MHEKSVKTKYNWVNIKNKLKTNFYAIKFNKSDKEITQNIQEFYLEIFLPPIFLLEISKSIFDIVKKKIMPIY